MPPESVWSTEDKRIARIGHPRVPAVGHRVFRDAPQVAVLDQVVKRLRCLLLVHGVGVDGRPHHVQSLLAAPLPGPT